MLLGGASIILVGFFKREMDIYKEVSGSKINFQKSKIFNWNCPIREMAGIARILGMEGTLSWDSFKYLGIPIFKSIPKVAHWMSLLDKLKIRIQAWGQSG